MADICSITVSAPPRNLATGDSVTFIPSEAVVTWSWGLQPATALIEWVSATQQAAIVPGSSIQITLGGHTFYGVTDNLVQRTASDGFSQVQEFRDNREFLMWDVIYAAFNLQDNRIINGRYQRRYRHLLPINYDTNYWTWTDEPYTAVQILNLIFESNTVQSPWVRFYDPLMANAVYDLDYQNGLKLGQVLVDISEKLGLVFTLMDGPYTLVWALKGVGPLPGFPVNSDTRRIGSALSGNPTRVRILGDRNRYQIMNCGLEPDWRPAWADFWDFGAFINDIFWNEATDGPLNVGPGSAFVAAGTPYAEIAGDTDHLIGYMLAGARARSLTVAQYANLRDARVDGGNDGENFRDYRRFQGRSRLQLPVALYLAQLLFRAFKLPDSFTFKAVSGRLIGRFGYDLDGRPIVEATHNATTGEIFALEDGFGNYEVPASEHNGYAIIRGFQVGQDAFRTLNPDYFDYESWISGQQLWQTAAFQIDDSGEGVQFLIFDQPVINSGDLITAAGNALPDGRARGMFNAAASFAVPPVWAALTFRAERFSWVQGLGERDDVINISQLAGEFLKLQATSTPVERTFSDGLTASEKAENYAALALNRQLYYQNGGYVVRGSNATTLSQVIDRVTLRWSANGGLEEEVDFTNERSRQVSVNPFGGMTLNLEPERNFDRNAQLDPLFPGQEELRAEARQLKLTAAVLRANPQMQRTLVDTFHLLMGLDTPPATVLIHGGLEGDFPDLAYGAPLFREATANTAQNPDGTTTLTAPVFVGVSVADGQDCAGGVRVTGTGNNGVVQARVKGPVAVAASVGLASNKTVQTYLEGAPTLLVGTAQEAIADATVKLIRVRLGSGGGGSPAKAVWL